MNLVVISGELSDMAEIKELSKDNFRVDGCLLKHYTRDDGIQFDKKFFFYASGKMAKKFMKNFEAGDNVVIRGMLTTHTYDNGTYITQIIAQSMTKISGVDDD